jgi:hypothetical protein
MFALGFLALLVPTLLLKQTHLSYLYRGGLTVVLKWAVLHPSVAQQAVYTTAFFARDVAEVFVIWGAFYLLGCGMLRLRPAIVTVVVVLAALVVMSANVLSFRELGTFLTLDTFLISVEWMSRNPEIIRQYVGWRNLAILPIAAVWAAAPVLLAKRLERRGADGRAARLLSPVALIAFAAFCAALSLSVRYLAFGGRLPLWGYWSSSAASLLEMQDRGARDVPLLGLDELRGQYRELAYPAGRRTVAPHMPVLDPAEIKPRHIVVIALETAPRKYYPILNNPALPAFFRMQKTAITSERHYTTRTSTTWSSYSILGGTYAPARKDVESFGPSESDGLASILAPRGYDATFVDSYRIDFHERDMHRSMWTNLGFGTLIDSESLAQPDTRDLYEKNLRKDESALAAVRDAVLAANRRGRKALTFLSTMLGHYEWKARPGDERLPGREKILGMCRDYDRMIGGLLDALEKEGLGRDIILVVTGDHGLRNEAEFDSLHEPMLLGGVSFNVPLLVYAPGLLKTETRLQYATSHVDLTPTLLEMTGTPAEGRFFHGESMLDPALEDRVIFLMNTGLIPTDGYTWKGLYFTYNSLSGMSEVGRSGAATAPGPPDEAVAATIPDALREPKLVLVRARDNFNRAARFFAGKRGTRTDGRSR